MLSRTFPLRMLVNSDMVGAIIGKSGSTIRSITQQTKARIDVHREESPEQSEKVVTISGQPDDCSEACFKIIEVIQNEKLAKHNDFNVNQDVVLKILAPGNFIGRLIGRSGASIKKMMDQTSTKISISINNLTESTGEHTITVIGRLEQVRQAEKLISSKLRSAFTSDLNNSLQTMSQQPYLFNNVPLSYMQNPYAQNPLLSLVNSASGSSGVGSISRSMPIPPHQNPMSGPIYPGATSYLPLYSNLNITSNGPSLLGLNPSVVNGLEQERELVFMYIPSSMVGAIIGKSGSAIKEMISTSGAVIKVDTTQATPTKNGGPSLNNADEDNAEQSANKEENNEKTVRPSSGPSGSTNPEQNETNDNQQIPTSTYQDRRSVGLIDNQVPNRRVTVFGYPASQYSAQCMIYRKISTESGKSDISLMVELQVPTQLVGRLIGKGGVAVKQLQMQTRTLIRLPDDKSNHAIDTAAKKGEFETTVQIIGEFEGSQAAQRHIRNIVRDSLHSRQNKSSQNAKNINDNNQTYKKVNSNSGGGAQKDCPDNNAIKQTATSENGLDITDSESIDKSHMTTLNEKVNALNTSSNDIPPLNESSSCGSCYHDQIVETNNEPKECHDISIND